MEIPQEYYPFANFMADKLPPAFTKALFSAISVGYEEAYSDEPKSESDLKYRYNELPHRRNAIIYEHLHQLSEKKGLAVQQRRLDNGYFFPEISNERLRMHIKHFNPHESLKDQVLKADYRKQEASANLRYGQMFLPNFNQFEQGQDVELTYVILFFEDSFDRKSELESVYFALPSTTGEILAVAALDEVILALDGSTGNKIGLEEPDDIEITPKGEDQLDEEAS